MNYNGDLTQSDKPVADRFTMELARGLSKRKELYEFEHPETVRGNAGGQATKEKHTGAKREVRDKPTFVESTSSLLNVSESNVEKTLQLNDMEKEIEDKPEMYTSVRALEKIIEERYINKLSRGTK